MGKCLARKNNQSAIAKQCTRDARTREHTIAALGKIMCKKMKKLCSEEVKSVQRAQSLKQFNWSDIVKEAEEHTPSMVQLLRAVTAKGGKSPANRKRQDNIIGVLLCILCKYRNPKMMIFQRVLSVILYAGHSAKQVSSYILLVLVMLGPHSPSLGSPPC